MKNKLVIKAIACVLASLMVISSVDVMPLRAQDNISETTSGNEAAQNEEVEIPDEEDVSEDEEIVDTTEDENLDMTSNQEDSEDELDENDAYSSIKYSSSKWTVVTAGGEKTLANWDDTRKKITFVADNSIESAPKGMFDVEGAPLNTDVKEIAFANECKITTIDANAFENCTGLVKVDFSNCKYTANGKVTGLTKIDNNAFKGCTSLRDLNLGTTVNTIGANAFESTSSLTTVKFPASITQINGRAFWKSGIETVEVNMKTMSRAGNEVFSECKIENITFGSDVTTVPAGLFYGAKFKTDEITVNIPKQIEIIDIYAFYGSNIGGINFDSDSKLRSISDYSFNTCKKLNNVTFPTSLEEIGAYAFNGCSKFTTIDLDNSGKGKIKKLGNYAFSGCESVTLLKLSSSISDMGTYVFSGMKGLTSVEIPMASIGSYAFNGCIGLTDVTLQDSVSKINAGAFCGCTSLTQIRLPYNVTTIGDYSFQNCTGLKVVEFTKASGKYNPELKTLGNRSFDNCAALERFNSEADYKVIIPDTITTIGDFAFNSTSEKSGFNTIILSENLEKIGQRAFYNTKAVKSITIPAKVNNIGMNAFASDTANGISTVNILGNGEKVTCGTGIFTNAAINTVTFSQTMKEIPANLFSEAGFVTDMSITIPSTVKYIGMNAFGGVSTESIKHEVNIKSVIFLTDESGKCSLEEIRTKAFTYNTSLTSFEIPDSVNLIGDNAFDHCEKLKGIVIPENVTSIGTAAFSNCKSLGDVHYNAIECKCKGDTFKDSCIVGAYIGPKVISLPAGLFAGAKFVDAAGKDAEKVEFVIPESMKELPEQALINISNLDTIIFVSDKTISKIGASAFQNCVKLANVYTNTSAKYSEADKKYIVDPAKNERRLPKSITTIGSSAFESCTTLSSIGLPDQLETIEGAAFKDCISLSKIEIPASVASIGEAAFNGCSNLESCEFKGSAIQTIQSNTFANCTKLKGEMIDGEWILDIPGGVTTINSRAYAGCSSLTAVDLSSNIQFIADDAFDGCTGITSWYALAGTAGEKWLKSKSQSVVNKNEIEYKNIIEGDINNNDGSFRAGEDYVFVDPFREGYTFKGWFEDAALTKKITSTGNKSGKVVVYASFEAKILNITFDNLEGGMIDPRNSDKIEYGKNLELYAAIRPGYELQNWVKLERTVDAKGNENVKEIPITAKTVDSEKVWVIENIKEDIEVRAKWIEYGYRVEFDLNGGTAREKFKSQLVSIAAKGDQEIRIPNSDAVTLKNNVLIEWNTSKDGTGTAYECGSTVKAIGKKNETVKLYAIWDTDFYYIQYVANGSKASLSENVVVKVTASLSHDKTLYSEANISRPGFKFVGWSTKKKSTSKNAQNYKPGQVIKGITEFGEKKFKKTIKLYAQWEAIPYTITYETNDGYFAKPEKVKDGFTAQKAYTFQKPKRDGYKFGGWYLTEDFTGKKVKNTKNLYSDIKLYAKWIPKNK